MPDVPGLPLVPASTSPTSSGGPGATIASLAALAVGLVATAGFLVLSALVSLCSIGGNTCTPEQDRTMNLAGVGFLASFLGVPALVAIARRDARWMYAPFIEVIVVMSIATVLVALS